MSIGKPLKNYASNLGKDRFISGLTNVTLTLPSATSESLVSDLLKFYKDLGFKSISNPSSSDNNCYWLVLDLVAAGVVTSSKADCNLAPIVSASNELLLNLILSDKKDTEEIGQSGIILTFSVPDIKGFLLHLNENDCSAQVRMINDSCFELKDPANNLVRFTSQLHPFSTGEPRATFIRNSCSRDDSSSPKDNEKKKRIAVLTSGGDSQGMNCAVRSVVRATIARGCEAYVVREGYQGLVDGGDKISPMNWGDVRRFVSVSGTIIGTARCMDFKERAGRLNGAYNLIINGIDALVVIGGDGSLTGADLFRSEWPGLVAELLTTNRINKEQSEVYGHLTIVGLVGSIDNDMAGTDFTIGAISSLHRICESVDNVTSTALSHRRAFVVEVMGRHCGWLALMAAVSTGADFVFLPEQPLDEDEWRTKMCNAIKAHRGLGRRATIVIVSEGAVDRNLVPIKSEYVAKVIEKECDLITRVTNLGHVQRGGIPAAQDRILGAVQGIQAVDVILNSTKDSESQLIAMRNNLTVPVNLMEAVQQTQKITQLVKEKKFDEAMKLRDPYFSALYDAYSHTEYKPSPQRNPASALRMGIIHIGAPAGGMNAATRTMARLAINEGYVPLGIHNGIRGLIDGEISELSWLQVVNWTSRGGSELGTNRDLPSVDYGMCAYQLMKHNISALLVIGGFEAYKAVHQLVDHRKDYPAFCIPIAYIPATISNNVPGADYSLGCDTSLNVITESCDRIIQSAASSHSRVFVVEVQGGHSGFLATMAGLSVGASRVYTPEEGITLKDLDRDVGHMRHKFLADAHRTDSTNVGRVVLVSDAASSTYKTEMISSIFAEEGKPLFDSRTSVLGHIQQGGITSPMDRIHAVLFAHRAFFWLRDQCQMATSSGNNPTIYTKSPSSAVVVGTQNGHVTFTSVKDLLANTDWVNRRPLTTWWDNCFAYNRLLAHYGKFFIDIH